MKDYCSYAGRKAKALSLGFLICVSTSISFGADESAFHHMSHNVQSLGDVNGTAVL